MPSIEVSKKDLEGLIGRTFSRAQLEEALEFVKGEIDSLEGDVLRIDCKETLRPDLWSAEGIAREIRARLGLEGGVKRYSVANSHVSVFVDENLSKVRPLIACAIVKNIRITEELLKQMIQLQEKVGESYGRRRKELGIGLYDFDKMKPPVRYKGFSDEQVSFVPLDWKVELRPSEVLAQHEKGKAYGHLLSGSKIYPIVIDADNVVASMPPIINSEATGKVTEKTRNLFIEVTGFNWRTVETALEVICMSLADRGGKIFSCKVVFPSAKKPYPAKQVFSPQFGKERMSFEKELVLKKTGLPLTDKEIVSLLSLARYSTSISAKKITVEYPTYRTDVMHAVDVIEDILISFGFNNIAPQKVSMDFVGSQLGEVKALDFVREACIGLGLQEVLTYNLSSRQNQSGGLLLHNEQFVEIANPVSLNYELLRKRLAAQLLDFCSKNKDKQYPQRIFELGSCLALDEKAENGVRQSSNLCVALTHSSANYTEIKSHFDSLIKYLGWKSSVQKKHFPFLSENSVEVLVNGKKGFMGEVKKEVLDAFALRKPVVLFEFEL